MEPELIEYLDGKFSHLEDEIRENREGIRENREAIRENTEGIRHTNIVLEDLRGTIELVAEGVVAVRERQDQDRLENDRKLGELRSLMEVGYRDLNRRVRVLEGN